MENVNKVANGMTFLVLGDLSAVIHPMYLHTNSQGMVQGILIDPHHCTREFAMNVTDFQTSRVTLVKGFV